MVKRLRYIGLKLTQDEYEYLINGEPVDEDIFSTEFQEYSSAGYGENDLGLLLQAETPSDNSGSVS